MSTTAQAGPNWDQMNKSIASAGASLQTFSSELRKLEALPVVDLAQNVARLASLMEGIDKNATASANELKKLNENQTKFERQLTAIDMKITALDEKVTTLGVGMRA